MVRAVIALTTHAMIGAPRSASFSRHSGYVMQDDAFIDTLTVYETLYYALCLRLPSEYRQTDDMADEIIENILETLNIKKVRDVQIGDPLRRQAVARSLSSNRYWRNLWWRASKAKYRRRNGNISIHFVYRRANVRLGFSQCFESDEGYQKLDRARFAAQKT